MKYRFISNSYILCPISLNTLNLVFTNPIHIFILYVVVFQAVSCVRLFETPWTAAHQAPLSSNISREFAQIHVH